jgi:glycosyltransferase involved in cell wall biosynthesis
VSRLLFLLPSVPVPLDAGARIRNNGLLKLLSAEHEVDAIAFGAPESAEALASLTRRASVVPLPPRRSLRTRAIDMATTGLPDMGLRLWSPAFEQALWCTLDSAAYDAVQAEGIEMAGYVDAVPPARRIYDAHNAEFLLQRRAAETATTLAARLYSRLQWRRLERFERQIVRHARMTLAVSQHDANQLVALAGPQAYVQVVPNAIDVTAYPFVAPTEHVAPNLLFVGKLDFRPNAQAVRWFVDNVLSAVKHVRLFAVGCAPPRWLVEAGQHDERIAVTGYVADERPYLSRCAALVLPVRAGGGSRLKALVAMASGLPIVSTRFGMQGLDAEPQTHYLLAESAGEWLASLSRVLGDAALRQHLALNGRRLVEERYDWSAIRADVTRAYAWLEA